MFFFLVLSALSYDPEHNHTHYPRPSGLPVGLSILASFSGLLTAMITLLLIYLCMRRCRPEKEINEDVPRVVENNQPPMGVSYPGNSDHIQSPLIVNQPPPQTVFVHYPGL